MTEVATKVRHFTRVADLTPHELALEDPDRIFNELERLGAIPDGEDNDDGLGI